MKLKLLLLGGIFSLLFASMPAKALDNYIVVDTQKVISESKVFKNVQSQLKDYAESMQSDYQKQEGVLKQEYDTLVSNKTNYAPKELDSKMKDIEKRAKVLQTTFAAKKDSYDKSSQETGKVIEDKAQSIVLKLAKDMKVDTVFQAYAFVSGTYPADKDKTDDVIKLLDKELSNIKVKKP